MRLFKFLIIVSLVTLPNIIHGQTIPVAPLDVTESKDAKHELTEVQKLKAENFQLKIQVAQLRVTVSDRETKLAQFELTIEQQKLVDEFRKQLNADEKDTFNWTTLKFDSPGKK